MDDLGDAWHKKGNAREAILDFAKLSGIDYVVTDPAVRQLPAFEKEFDMVMLHDVLEHMHDSPRDLLIGLLEKTRAGGLLYITVLNHVNLRKRFAVATGKTGDAKLQFLLLVPRELARPRTRVHEGDCVTLAEALGLEIVEIEAVHNMLERIPERFRPAYRKLSGLAPSIRDTWAMVAKKPVNWHPKREISEEEFTALSGLKNWAAN